MRARYLRDQADAIWAAAAPCPEHWTRAIDANQGWRAIEDRVKVIRWSRARRVGVLRRRIRNDLALTLNQKSRKGKSEPGHLVLAPSADEVQDNPQMSEYKVLVTDIWYELVAIGQLYRDCGDCRACQGSGFGELKKQWGWGRITMQGMLGSSPSSTMPVA